MNEMKEAWRLATFEIKASLKWTILQFLFALLFGWFFSMTLPDGKDHLMFDLFLVLMFWAGSSWLRPKVFQLQKLDEGVHASTYFLMLNQLPVKRNTLINSRLLVHYTFSIPFNLLMLISLFILSTEVPTIMPDSSFLVFSVIWLSFGIVAGSMFPTADIGEKLKGGKVAIVLSVILFYGAAGAVLVLVNLFTSRSIAGWSIYAAVNWPIASIIISIAAVILSIWYTKRYMSRKIPTIDYLK
ncbi:hypothetical protein [Cytobacillus purgationiresistens]|uniref:ABC-2 type transport system permease protein n=1 Tax=Cytobacillus purgationiresistens TaxID=863449 RepID=A0ABU0APK9_9BACI|nr:hypothetical protein [Cytobacillus purgationiresistens]MDQ0273221.1 hypothetical protein [Cytobacillus purgationiresistens]